MHEHRRLITTPQRTPMGSILLAGVHKEGHGVNKIGKLRAFDGCALVLITRGEGFYKDNRNKKLSVKKGDAILVFPGVPHFYGPNKGTTWDEIYVAFDGVLFESWFRSGLLKPDAPIRSLVDRIDNASSWLMIWIEQFSKLTDQAKQIQAMTALMSFLCEIALGDGYAAPVQDAWLSKAKGLLSYDLKGPIDLERVATEMSMSYEAFRKKFQTQAKISPLRYRNERKVESAKQLIRYAPHSSNREIADALGFADEFHFSKRFRQMVGVSPNVFRKSLKA